MTPHWCDGRLLAFDLETTGVDPFTALPVSYSLALREPDRDKLKVMRSIVNPGVEVPADAAKIHGITTERAQAEGIPLSAALAEILEKLLWAASEGIPVMGTNLAYDFTIVETQSVIRGYGGLRKTGWAGPALDVYVLDKQLDQYRKGSRRLAALAGTYRVSLDEAHDATSDAIACIGIVLEMARRHDSVRVKAATELHRLQVIWRREQQRSLSEYFVEQGNPAIPEHEWAWPLYDPPPEA